jgi:signal transduction protein with GAF and PtsI domain
LNQINEKTSGDLELFTITENAINYLAEYLNAQVGAVYNADLMEKKLLLMGSYAFTKRKGLNEKIDFGQGLVGEAARTQKDFSN